MNYKDFGVRVRKKRQQKGWTQEMLAKELSTSTSFVGHIERGTRKASLDTLVKVANVLDVSTDYLLASSLKKVEDQPEEKQVLSPGQRLAMREMLTVMQKQLENWDEDEEEK